MWAFMPFFSAASLSSSMALAVMAVMGRSFTSLRGRARIARDFPELDRFLFGKETEAEQKAAPETGAAIVTKDTQNSRYYVHEVVDADGNLLFKNNEIPASASDGTSALSGDLDTVANAGKAQTSPSDGRASLKGTFDTVETSGAEGTRPLSFDPTIAQGAENVKPSGVDDGLGAAETDWYNDAETWARIARDFPELDRLLFKKKAASETGAEVEDIKIEPPTRSSSPKSSAVHLENTRGSMEPPARSSSPENPAGRPVNAIDDSIDII